MLHPQQENSPWEAHAPQPESSPCSPQLEKATRSNEDPAQPKVKGRKEEGKSFWGEDDEAKP